MRLQTAPLFLACAALLQAQGPPPGSGQTIQSLAAALAALTTRVTNLEGRATSLEGRATTVEGRATSLEGRASKLEGQIVAADLAGTYGIYGFQNELSTAGVSSYVHVGTFVLLANGTYTTNVTETGNSLLFTTPRSVQDFTGAGTGCPCSGNWTYANGMLNIEGISLSVYAGGRLMVTAGANHSDRTNVILIMARLQ